MTRAQFLPDIAVTQPGALVTDLRAYSTLALALTGIGSTPSTLLISRDETVAAGTTTIPSNVTLKGINGSILTVPAGATLAINGPIEHDRKQIFDDTGGTITIGNLTKITFPEWFGAKGDAVFSSTWSGTDDLAALDATVASLSSGGTISFGASAYYLSDTLYNTNSFISFIGQGMFETKLVHTGSTTVGGLFIPSGLYNAGVWSVIAIEGIEVRDLGIETYKDGATGAAENGITLYGVDGCIIENVYTKTPHKGITITSVDGTTTKNIRLNNIYCSYSSATDDCKGIRVSNDDIIDGSTGTVENVFVSNFYLFGTDVSGSIGIQSRGSDVGTRDAKVKNVRFENGIVSGYESGGYIGSQGSTSQTSNITIREVKFEDNSLYSLGLNADHVNVVGCDFGMGTTVPSTYCISSAGGASIRVDKNNFHGWDTVPILLGTVADARVWITDNDFLQTTEPASDVGGVHSDIVTDADTGTYYVEIKGNKYSDITPVSGTYERINIRSSATYLVPMSDGLETRHFRLTDDAATSFTPDYTYGTLAVMYDGSIGFSGMVLFNVAAAGAECVAVGNGANFDVATGALAGNTGNDNKVTVSTHTDGKIYIENRSGSANNFYVKLLIGNNS